MHFTLIGSAVTEQGKSHELVIGNYSGKSSLSGTAEAFFVPHCFQDSIALRSTQPSFRRVVEGTAAYPPIFLLAGHDK